LYKKYFYICYSNLKQRAMKKIISFLTLVFALAIWQINAQAVNEPANWPNTNWTVNQIAHTGSNAMDIEADPTTDANFAYDDDDTGSGSHDEIAAESPVIDLTAAFNAGETNIFVEGEYVYNNYDNNEILAIQYWDADSSAWVTFYQFPNADTQGAPNGNFCSGTPESYSATFDISGFSATQLSCFKYRFYYNDDATGGDGWNWGFCFSSPVLYSAGYSNPVFTTNVIPDCANDEFSVDVYVTDLGGASEVTVAENVTGLSTIFTQPDTITFGPFASGTLVTITVTNNNDTSFSSSEDVQYFCPPANDSCSAAIALTVYPQGGSAGNETSASTEHATASSMSHTSCDSYGTNLDLFYSFTAPNSGKIKVLTGGPEGDNIEAAVYDACGGNELACFGTGNEKTVTGLTAGQTYILQVWHDSFNSGDFTIVLEEIQYTNPVFDLTAMDDCNNAQFTVEVNVTDLGGASSVTVADDQGSPTQTLSTTGIATFGPYPEGTNVTFTVTNNDDNNYSSSDSIQFFCPPANDDCSGAVALTLSQTCSPVTATNQGATDSGIPDPGCGGYQGGDVWFTVTAQSDTLVVETSSVSGSNVSDTGMAIYSGDCSNLTLIECNDDGGSGLFSQIAMDATAGTTYYVRVWEYGNNSFGEFNVCAYDPTLSTENELLAYDFTFYPNPTSGIIHFRANQSVDKVEITNLAGQVLLARKHTESINTGNLPAGIYLLNVYIDGKKGVYKLIKQ
jgi:hypothetical protein